MKRLPFIIVMLISIAAFGQDGNKEKSKSTDFRKLLFGINVSPDLCYRTLKNNDGSSLTSTFIEIFNENEEPKFGYTGGINICYNISKHLGIEAGVQYSNKGYAFNNTEVTFNDTIDPRYGFIYATNGTPQPTEAKFIYNHIYLDIL